MSKECEFDELFLKNVAVHVERMDARTVWIGIDLADGSQVHINTGIERGIWFFSVWKESKDGESFQCFKRPACYRQHKPVREAAK